MKIWAVTRTIYYDTFNDEMEESTVTYGYYATKELAEKANQKYHCTVTEINVVDREEDIDTYARAEYL